MLSLRTLALSALIVAASLTLTACGGDEGGPSESAANAPAPGATKAPELESVPPARRPASPATAPTTTREPDPERRRGGIRFEEGFEAGVKAAADPDRVMFVYVGRKSPT